MTTVRINLLPHREAARKARKEAFQVMLGVSALVGLAVAGAIYLWFQARIETQRERNQFLQSQIQVLDVQIKEIATIEQEITALTARQKAVEDLQADRNLPVHLLNELVKQLPDGVYITSLKQDDQAVTLQGVAQSNERISELLRNLADNTPWLSRPDLAEIVAGNVALGPRDNRRVANFNLRVRLVRASEVAAAAKAASAPAAAKP
ncbi:PilN domain-containing protein [Pseudorhodoferax sp. Leaf265]|jgi:type IV pilus assembly protein PilN|uniref:PilN domain-containing protein n=1 Tax=Pseudorhodoferax sp. Leaf265 TaxID=1736315 RepID=UPI0006FFF68E|nr:PilN domain-containing protein [Pseudorhodoferax sp. Leaf265]KQP02871.1 fimbrial protein [Pseudorhodoferax sp. Leaf265]PZP97887.1 MAG: fimbrial protein [Variovorax paradoxus]PZQ09181.1 MAG: fimbrial protein [Variovorax paradoxus]